MEALVKYATCDPSGWVLKPGHGHREPGAIGGSSTYAGHFHAVDDRALCSGHHPE